MTGLRVHKPAGLARAQALPEAPAMLWSSRLSEAGAWSWPARVRCSRGSLLPADAG